MTANLRLGMATSVALADGASIVVDSIVTESIEAAPDDAGAYPAGSGVTVGLTLAGEELTLTLLSEGYRSTPVGWLDGYRVELVKADERTAELAVHRVSDRVQGTRQLRVRRGDRVKLFEETDFEFVGHTHKSVTQGMESPLMVMANYHDGSVSPETHSIFPPREPSWTRRDLRFTVVSYAYDDFMDLRVERLALEPLDPAG